MADRCQGNDHKFLGSCDRKPSVVCDGKHYCWQHDPERLKSAAAERWAKRKQEITATEAKIDAEIETRKLKRESGIDALTDDDLRKIIKLGGIKAILQR